MALAGCFSNLSRPMPPIAYFGIESSGLNLAVDLLIVFVVVLYLASIYWTYADARRRVQDPVLVGAAVVAALFPFAGPVIYMVVRPPEYLEDVRERELETRAAEARVRELDQTQCPHCSYRIERDFIRCPSCLRKLKERCANCARPLERTWTICPYCEADVPGLAPSRSRRRRGANAKSGLSPAASAEGDGQAGELSELALPGEGDATPVAAPNGELVASSPPGETPALAAAPSPPPDTSPLTGDPLTPAERRSAERRSAGSGRAADRRSASPGGRKRPGV